MQMHPEMFFPKFRRWVRQVGLSYMVVGSAKNGFPVANTSLCVPTVVIGKHKVNYPSSIPIISIPCETGEGKFVVDIALKVPG